MKEKENNAFSPEIKKNDHDYDSVFSEEFSDLIPNDPVYHYKKKLERKMRHKFEKKLSKIGKNMLFPSNMPNIPGMLSLTEDQNGQDMSMTWEKYKKIITSRADKSRVELSSHIGIYIAVNVALFVINMITSFSYPWFLFPLGGWGIGIISHAVDNYLKQMHKKDVEKLPPLSPEALSVFHKQKRANYGFSSHLGSYVAVNGFLLMVNFITSMAFPWFIIPAAAWGVGLFSHFMAFRAQSRSLKKKLNELKSKVGAFFTQGKKDATGERDPLMTELYQLNDSIINEINTSSEKGMPIDSEIKPVLESYMKQVEDLNKRYREIDGLIRSIPMSDLETDLERLKQKLETATTPYMKKEYEKSIKEIEQHKHSFEELINQKEIIHLRFKSSVNHLKQLKIDLARMKGIITSGDEASVSQLKEKTKELSQYLDDLRQGYSELEED